jgi:zinc/manganese transport system ATP-binding protein
MAADDGIRLSKVTVRYGRRLALEAVTGGFAAGSLTAVIGANGAGKSTLLAAIAGVVPLWRGTVECHQRRRLAFLPQVSTLDRDYPLNVAELITLGGWRQFGAFGAPARALRRQVAAAAETVGLADRLSRPIAELSTGELQRTLFARLIVQDAAIILLDEPFAAVDAGSLEVLLDQVGRWHREARTVVVVIHDLDLVERYFPTTLVLAGRCLAWGATASALRHLPGLSA